MEKAKLADIGRRLRQRRTELGLTREKMAELADIGTGYYGQLEIGTSQMSLDTLLKLAQAMHVSTDHILFGDDRTPGDASPVIDLLNRCTPRELKLAEEVLKLFLLHNPHGNDGEKAYKERRLPLFLSLRRVRFVLFRRFHSIAEHLTGFFDFLRVRVRIVPECRALILVPQLFADTCHIGPCGYGNTSKGMTEFMRVQVVDSILLPELPAIVLGS